MTKRKELWLEREEERLAGGDAAAREAAQDESPQDRLVRAAREGRFEELVAQAQPTEPIKMVTPEEREQALREAGQWPAPKAPPPATSSKEKPAEETPPPAPPPEPTPNEAFIAENCRWVPVSERVHRSTPPPYGRVLTEYDPLTGEIIGDGYIHYDDDDDDY
jgi:hypothetical protein